MTSYKKMFLGTPPKFHGKSNSAIKIFGYRIFNLHLTGSRTGSDVINVGNRLLKALTGYTDSLYSKWSFVYKLLIG